MIGVIAYFVFCIIVFAVITFFAPEGYQDDSGFYYGKDEKDS